MAFDSREFEYADIKVALLGSNLEGLRGIKFKKKQEKEPVHGQGSDPKSIQRGNKSYEGTLTVLKSDYDMLTDAAINAGYEDISDVPAKLINITVVYDKGDGSPLRTVKLLKVEFTDEEDGMKSGDKFNEVELPFICLKRTFGK
jgi:hypothetical protein